MESEIRVNLPELGEDPISQHLQPRGPGSADLLRETVAYPLARAPCCSRRELDMRTRPRALVALGAAGLGDHDRRWQERGWAGLTVSALHNRSRVQHIPGEKLLSVKTNSIAFCASARS